MTTVEKLTALRGLMKSNGVAAVVVANGDPHNNEYQAPRWQSREWLSGFKGSNGTMVVTADKSGLWTDSRYYVAAEEVLQGTETQLFRASDPGVETLVEWLKSELNEGDVVSFSGENVSEANASAWISLFKVAKISCRTDQDLVDEIWENRPAAPCGKFYMVDDSLTGETSAAKLQRLRTLMKSRGIEAYLLGRTDESNWLLNFRGTDIENYTTPYCYTLITGDSATFFVDPAKLDGDARTRIEGAGFTIKGYDDVAAALAEMGEETRLLMIPEYTNHNLYQAGSHCFLVKDRALVTDLKAIKNSVEVDNFHKVSILDGSAMVKFYFWMFSELKAGRKVSELSASRKLRDFRSELPGYRHIGFDSIMGYKSHGALNHYSVNEESDFELSLDGLFLIDSGGCYENGLTDTTRVVPMGSPTEQEKMDYTLVLCCMIELLTAEFPVGSTGAQLDGICRRPMWNHHRHYGHGTGHGVGYGTEIHEGPQNFSLRGVEEFKVGMVTTIEPGIYRPGEYGIRIENMVHTVVSGDSDFGKFLKFENLTINPINVDLVDAQYLEARHLTWLNNYNAEVYEKLSPLLNEQEAAWLKHECRAVC